MYRLKTRDITDITREREKYWEVEWGVDKYKIFQCIYLVLENNCYHVWGCSRSNIDDDSYRMRPERKYEMVWIQSINAGTPWLTLTSLPLALCTPYIETQGKGTWIGWKCNTHDSYFKPNY